METKQESWGPTVDQGEPTYWISYEYRQIQAEMVKLNEKMDLILSIIQKKPRKNALSDKMDNLIDILDKKNT